MYLDVLEHIKNKLNISLEQVKTISESDVESPLLGEDISMLINNLSDCLLKAKELPREYGMPFDYDGVEIPIEIKEIIEGEIVVGYHFILPCLLDKREQNNIYNKTREHAKKTFLSAFEKYSNEVGFIHITDKVIIKYINHFKDKRSMIDNDNIDTKAFTDMITTYILDDDNPDKEELYIKGLSDGASYTEVYVSTI